MNIGFWLEAGFVIALGLCVGSFLNVVIIRLPRGRSLVRPSSRCGFCRSTISKIFNIPLFGFLASQGVCQKCGHPYSARYFFVEVIMGVLAIALWDVYGLDQSFYFALAFVALLIAMSFIDIELKLIPDALSLGGWAVAMVLAALNLPSEPFFDRSLLGVEMPLFFQTAIGSVFGYGLFWGLSRAYVFVRKEEGLGGGDVKLMGLVGAVIGIQGVLATTMIGSVLALLAGGIGILIHGRTKHFPIPFGPALAMGALVVVFRLDGWIWF